MKALLKVLLSLFFTLIVTLSFSQIGGAIEKQFDEDFKKISSALSVANYSINTEYNFYNNYSTKQPYKSIPGYYVKRGNDYRSLALGILTIQKINYKVFVDTLSKTIVVANSDEQANTKSLGIDTGILKMYCNKLEKRDSSIENRTYRLYFKQSIDNVSSIEIVFNLKGNYIKKMVLYHASKIDLTGAGTGNIDRPRTEVVFKKPEFDKASETDFSIDRYLTIKKDNISLSANYSNYKFYNHLLKK